MLVRTVLLPVRLTYGVGKVSAKGGYRAGRLLGYRRVLTLGVGIGIGLLVAPTSGQELRNTLRRRWEDRGSPDSDEVIAERVRYELSHSPRTWHLPQPKVEVVGGTAILRGAIPHATGKDDLERTAAAVNGVVEIDSQLVVGAASDGDG